MIFKVLLGSFALALGASSALATPLLIGTYTGKESKGIYLYHFDDRSGRIDARPVQVMTADNPSWLVLSPDHRLLYAVDENGEGGRDPVGRASAFRMEPTSGRMTFINRVSTLGAEPTHASLSKDGRYLFVANYAVSPDPGGTLSVLPVGKGGALGPVTQVKTFRASMVNPERQASPHIHSVVSSPDGRFVFVQDLGGDRVYAYRYNPEHRETPLSALRDAPFTELPKGSGPRHLIFSPDGRHAYLTLEMSGQVAVLDHAEGRLTLRQLVALAPDGFSGKVSAAGLHFSPDGRFLAVTNRGTDNQLLSFRISPEDGTLHLADRRSVEGKEPREFAFSPDGRFVLIANQRSHAINVFRRDPASGTVKEQVQSLSIDQASDIKFLTR
ncbi:lactonase family protein [Novosphingobium sp. KACC 22771]|uniref:lactonase family protein n=1 Tax=Novosphingobium sp. KACC 22771 TaxID=3025670 RepID=UPI0023659CE7|nr:lactonase family protein [Novosphingobium sp. KACC 22771]WDF75192.1 lactonase family protein [Novosphingobium sp. KACC 22771]